jgi:hypothetical protein
MEPAATYLRAAVADIDNVFGKGYARSHPELVAAYMNTLNQRILASGELTLRDPPEAVSHPSSEWVDEYAEWRERYMSR